MPADEFHQQLSQSDALSLLANIVMAWKTLCFGFMIDNDQRLSDVRGPREDRR